ncbi:MAG: TrmH family RNA methyltransferase, partial [Candidatus Daviesbacteria bacterium]|nr:TrmH family RNA methyltransferase [Candidatus Daviesbacteria bacterium]
VYKESAIEAINDLRSTINNIQIVAIEQSKKSVLYNQFDYTVPICLIVGNESYGVSKDVLEICDGIVEIPMHGVNISLNVIVSLAVTLYHLLNNVKSP